MIGDVWFILGLEIMKIISYKMLTVMEEICRLLEAISELEERFINYSEK